MREAYRAAGFLPASYPRVQDDFIGLELDFLAKLSDAALACWEAGDEILVDKRLRQSRNFLETHLLRWIDSLADTIAAEYGDLFYARFTRLAALVSHRDFDVLTNLDRDPTEVDPAIGSAGIGRSLLLSPGRGTVVFGGKGAGRSV